MTALSLVFGAAVSAAAPVHAATPQGTVRAPLIGVGAIADAGLGGPRILGAAVVGDTLAVDAGAWEPEVDLSYQWRADGVVLPDATQAAFTISPGLVGARLSVDVTATGGGTEPTTVTVAAAARVALAGSPSIVGVGVVGKTLSVSPGAWTPGTEFSYRWAADGVDLAGATGATLELEPALESARISVRVTGVKPEYESVTRTTNPTPRVPRPGAASISGDLAVGETLSLSTSGWTGGSILTPTWFANGVQVASGRWTLVLTPDLAGKTILGRVVALKSEHLAIMTSTIATAPVMGWPAPSVAGPMAVGGTVWADTTGWLPATDFTYQWFADSVAIAGATAARFTIPKSLADRQLTVGVAGRLDGYPVRSNTSSAVGKIAWASQPIVVGLPIAGARVTASSIGASGATISYQWYVNGVPISGANTASFVVPSGSLGLPLTVRATHLNPGYATVQWDSSPLYPQSPRTPTLAGTPRVGATLSAVPTGWAPGTRFEYEWLANGRPVPGGSSRLHLDSSLSDVRISVRVYGTLPDGITYVRESAKTAKVATTGTPKISGTAKVGNRMKAKPGTWTKGTKLSYQWYANGVAIKKATKSTFTPKAGHRGKRITVVVKGKKSGYATVAKTSKATAKVKR